MESRSDKKSNTANRPVSICLHNLHFNERLRLYGSDAKPDKSAEANLFVGRRSIIAKLKKLLHQTQDSRGCFLISGYRGVGKTTVVERTINAYENERKNSTHPLSSTNFSSLFSLPIITRHVTRSIISLLNPLYYSNPQHDVIQIPVNLGESKQLTPADIYFTITNILYEKVKCYFKTRHQLLSWILILIIGGSLIELLLPFIHHFNANTFTRFMNQTAFCSLIDCWSISTTQYYTSVVLVLFSSASLWFRGKLKRAAILGRLETLALRMKYNIEEQRQFSAASNWLSFGRSRVFKSLPLNAREVEYELIQILATLRSKDNFGADIIFIFDEIDKLSEHNLYENESDRRRSNELSKLNSSDKLDRINELFCTIKYFITTAQARIFIISGRETLDSYYSEKGSANSLYESLFDQVFEIPSLLTDPLDPSVSIKPGQNDHNSPTKLRITRRIEEYLCARLGNIDGEHTQRFRSLNEYYRTLLNQAGNNILHKEEARNTVYVLRNFIYYLAFHSWGNPKRLATIFSNFIAPKAISKQRHPLHVELSHQSNKNKYWLNFSFDDLRSFVLAGNIFTLFQHQISREVSRIGDKLTVSSLSSLQFILKLHPYGFTRESLFRMSEAINIHRAPELNVIVDDLLSQIFKSYIRRVRNGAYRYRFNAGFEQELRYITHVSGLESASYNFSLDAMNRVKQHFENDLLIAKDQQCTGNALKAHITLGDMNAIEQSYNAASRHYTNAINILRNDLQNHEMFLSNLQNSTDQVQRWRDIEIIMSYAEVMLKYGDLEEHRQNYNKAAGVYTQATQLIEDIYLSRNQTLSLSSQSIEHASSEFNDQLQSGDSKWDIIKQTYWAKYFLGLKRSPISHNTKRLQESVADSSAPINDTPPPPKLWFYDNDPRFYFRRATLNFYLGWSQLDNAILDNAKAIFYARNHLVNSQSYLTNERRDYLVASALVAMVEATLLKKSVQLLEKLNRLQEVENTANYRLLHLQLSDDLLQFIEPGNLSTYDAPIYAPNNADLNKLGDLFDDQNELFIIRSLQTAANLYESNNLYISATLTNIKLIAYLYMIMDCFTQDFINARSNTTMFNGMFEAIDLATRNALRCIDYARQLESSQFIKTLVTRDLDEGATDNTDTLLTQLFELFDPENTREADHFPSHEQCFWQHSIWGNKLISILYWGDYIRYKLGFRSTPSRLNSAFVPDSLPGLSIRSSILMRWIYARQLFNNNINSRFSAFLSSYAEFEKSDEALDFVHKLTTFGENQSNDLWDRAYEIARILYFVQLDVRLISRKNLDLIYPMMTQILYVHWRLLSRMAKLITVYAQHCRIKHIQLPYTISSVRDISTLIQSKFMDLERHYDSKDTIGSSHFDYEYITIKMSVLLKEAINLVDQTSRIRTNILQQKYFAHDDYSDPEFRMDWTLANLMAPSAKCMLTHVQSFDDWLRSEC